MNLYYPSYLKCLLCFIFSFFVFSILLTIPAQAQWSEIQKVLAATVEMDDEFGYSVAIDGTFAVVGAHQDDNSNGNKAGAVYVFEFNSPTWVLTQTLIASDGEDNDHFGTSVAISGSNIIVGADEHDLTGADKAGAAYIFSYDGSTWSEQAKLTASDAAKDDMFGYSVSISGNTAIVGAFEEDNANGDKAGAAYIYDLTAGTWTQTTKLTASNGAKDDRFGNAVDIFGTTAIVGAFKDDNANGDHAGAVYVYDLVSGSWTETDILTASNGDKDDQFGFSLAIYGDQIVIGANLDENATNNKTGSAYVFSRSAGVWTEDANLVASDADTYDQFGYSVDISNCNYLIIGAFEKEINSNDKAGAAYIFSYDGSTWTQSNQIIASDSDKDERFGNAVAISGNRALVGAFKHDENSEDKAGAAYFFNPAGVSANCSDFPWDGN